MPKLRLIHIAACDVTSLKYRKRKLEFRVLFRMWDILNSHLAYYYILFVENKSSDFLRVIFS